jgi:predicted phage tail protein
VTAQAVPPAGTYEFAIGPLRLVALNTATSTSGVQKVNNTSAQFRRGFEIQNPLSEIGGVGASPAIGGILNDATLKQAGTMPADLSGRRYSTSGYPEGVQDFGAPKTISAINAGGNTFNLTASQVAEVDELRIAIGYGSLTSTSKNSGDSGNGTALYDISIQTKLDGTTSDWTNLFVGDVVHSNDFTSPISYEHTIQLESFRPFDDFTIRITRLSRQSGTAVRADGTDTRAGRTGDTTSAISSVQSIIKEKFYYPGTAYSGITFSSQTYDTLPVRTYDCRGLMVRIPTTYTTREKAPSDDPADLYSGFWNGSFKAEKEYTDNPAWVFYDIIANNRYGAGTWIPESDINKFALYRIARYCDELVDDGNGGTEPRFRANLYLTKATDVYKVLKDMATIFTGMLYYLEGAVTPVMDSPADPVYAFSKGNVIDGSFGYESTGAKTRVNQVIVSWNNPANGYQNEALIVEDRDAILKTGKIISETAVAFGCTSEGQATRYGRWKLYTGQKQTEIVTFKTALAAGFLQPGDITSLQDADRYGTMLSGRLQAGNNSTTVNLDRTVTLRVGYTYTVSILVTSPAAFLAQDTATKGAVVYTQGDRIPGITTEASATSLYDDAGTSMAITWKPYTYADTKDVTTGAGDVAALTISGTFSETPLADSVWALKEFESSGGNIRSGTLPKA